MARISGSQVFKDLSYLAGFIALIVVPTFYVAGLGSKMDKTGIEFKNALKESRMELKESQKKLSKSAHENTMQLQTINRKLDSLNSTLNASLSNIKNLVRAKVKEQ